MPETQTHIKQDPYSWGMTRIVASLTKAMTYNGAMNDTEYDTLLAIRRIIEARDPEALNAPSVKTIVLRR